MPRKSRFHHVVFIQTLTWIGATVWEESPLVCPACGLYGRPVRIVYGYPTPEALARHAGREDPSGWMHDFWREPPLGPDQLDRGSGF